ncbi:enolase C-terminal domain-like protein [Nonomuraea longicatena]|uniref:Mandelate racemase/muconate lactonizing enzyme C-terminal domain-containing protein n=1 Tax=Nonomuraea longicatena TaxID=83682 RepID=A0ABN1P9M9_9ACTN
MHKVRIAQAQASFRDVVLDHPLRLAGASVDRFTLAVVQVRAEGPGGPVAGTGASVLSVPWSWPRSDLSWQARDAVLRDLAATLCASAATRPPGDPFALFDHLATVAGGAAPEVPALARSLALGAVDNAVHDAWSRAADLPAALVNADLLNADLGATADRGARSAGPEGAGGRYARARGRGARPVGQHAARGRYARARATPDGGATLEVQHVAGVGDPLDELREWLVRDGIRHVKVKLSGRDPREDAARVVEVHRVLRASVPGRISLSLDPNEGYATPADATRMIEHLAAAEAFADVGYMEQPVPRDSAPDPGAMRELCALLPVLADEGLAGVGDLDRLAAEGWAGLVVKAARGQSLALRSWEYAVTRGMFVVVQDLTAVDLALAHSARLAATLPLSWRAFECNSRQYAPHANAALPFMDVTDGLITLGPPTPGIV